MREIQFTNLSLRSHRIGLGNKLQHLGFATRQTLDCLYLSVHRETEYIAGRNQFFIDNRIDTHTLGQIDEIEVLHLSNHLLDPKTFGHHGCQNVGLGTPRHCYKSIHVAQPLFDH